MTAQADAPYRIDQAKIAQLKVRSANGAMVPLGSLATFREIAGPQRVPRYNLYPAIEMQGTTAPGVSSGEGIQIMERPCHRASCPDGISYRVDGPCPIRRRIRGRPPSLSSALRCCSCILALAAAIRELEPAARHHPDRADVSFVRDPGRARRTGRT